MAKDIVTDLIASFVLYGWLLPLAAAAVWVGITLVVLGWGE